jgi:hypothetical protein
MNTRHEYTDNKRNGARAADEVHFSKTPGFVASSSRDADRRASEQRRIKLSQRVEHYGEICADLQTRLDGAVLRRDGLPDHARGWPLVMYLLLALLTIGLEYVPADMFTQIFNQVGWVQRALTLTFTSIGVVVAIFFGELLRRLRVPERSHVVDRVFIAVVGIVAVGYLLIGYMLRIAYTTKAAELAHALAARQNASGIAAAGPLFGLSPSTEAIALTAVAAIGIILTVVSTFHRESLESFGVHSRIANLNRELEMNEQHKKANESDLARVANSGNAGQPVETAEPAASVEPKPAPTAVAPDEATPKS